LSSIVHIIYAQCLDFIVNNFLADLRKIKENMEAFVYNCKFENHFQVVFFEFLYLNVTH